MLRPVVEPLADLLAQPLPAFGTGFNMRIPSSGGPGSLPAHGKAKEVEAVLTAGQSAFLFIEFQSLCLQPASKSFQQRGSLSGCAQDDKVIGVAHQAPVVHERWRR